LGKSAPYIRRRVTEHHANKWDTPVTTFD
jgi:hypothetical protein